MGGKSLQDHVFDTYLSLRVGMAIIALAFPPVVVATGFLLDDGLPIQASLSAYYWASKTGFNPSRVAFVGGLFAVSAFLYLYKGFTSRENYALNAAALFALGVACFPMKWTCAGCDGWTPHGFCAISLFACLFYVVWFRSGDTLQYLPSNVSRTPYVAKYRVIATFMAVCPLVALATNWILGERLFVLFVEALGIWSFAVYWYEKSNELKTSHATRRALAGVLPAYGANADGALGGELAHAVERQHLEAGTKRDWAPSTPAATSGNSAVAVPHGRSV